MAEMERTGLAVWLSLARVSIFELRIREVADKELPEPLRSEAAWNALKKKMKWFRSNLGVRDTGRMSNPETREEP
jgi:hypothetical protein